MLSTKLINRIRAITYDLQHLPQGRHKHFSFIVKRNTIISVGWNKGFQTHPIAARFGHRFQSIHSELDAILNFPYGIGELHRYNFINVRLTKVGLGMSLPCKHCEKMLSYFGVDRVIFSNYEGFYETRTIA